MKAIILTITALVLSSFIYAKENLSDLSKLYASVGATQTTVGSSNSLNGAKSIVGFSSEIYPNISWEVQNGNLGNQTLVTNLLAVQTSYQTLGLSALFHQDRFNNNILLFGKVGIQWLRAETRVVVAGGSSSGTTSSNSKSDPIFGGGIIGNINKNWGIRGEFEIMEDDIDVVSVSLMYTF